MQTSAISQRVADFLKKHPPFHAVADADLLELAAKGRVRFHERNDYILWQGQPHRMEVSVIQQGTVSLWDEASEYAELRDVRGAGDMLGVEQFHDDGVSLHSARSSSDVVLYTFSAIDFEALVLKYAHARDYVAAHSGVSLTYQSPGERSTPHAIYLHERVQQSVAPRCAPEDTIREAARRLWTSGVDAVAIVDSSERARGVLTRSRLLQWIAEDAQNADGALASLSPSALPTVAPGASITDAVIAMATADTSMLAVTDDGTREGRLQTIITAQDLAPAFGEQPLQVVQDIRRVTAASELGALNRRARGLVLEHLSSATAVPWLAQYTHLVDARIVNQILLTIGPPSTSCWCFFGASGRGESLTRQLPRIVAIVGDERDYARAERDYGRLREALSACEYLPRITSSVDDSFQVATVAEWTARYTNWIRDPILQEVYRTRSLFDLRPVHGQVDLWRTLRASVDASVNRDFLHVLANDCLTRLPPLTFFENAVVDTSGEHTDVFRLEETALRPLVDVGRVFGLAARRAFGSSTQERFQTARALLPPHESIFRDAFDTLLVVLWQQGRVGIAQSNGGTELPPSLLSRNDRQMLKSGFRSILRLVEFTADPAWLDAL